MTYSTSAYPYDSVCLVTDTIDGVNYRASGVIIGPHTILTAAHVVWDATSDQSATNVEVLPGYGSYSTEFAGAAIHYNAVDDSGGLISESQSQDDFAIIDVSQDLSAYGSFGVDLNYTGSSASISGYPGTAGYSQVTNTGAVTADPYYNLLDYGSDLGVHGGSSGGPIWVDQNGVAEVAGLVSTDAWGAELTSSDWTEIQGWIAQDAHLWTASFNENDVVFRETATGDWGYMAVNPAGGETWTSVGPSSTGYTSIGTGDFNGDGLLDVAFRNTATGDWGFMTPNVGGGETWHPVGPTSTGYSVVAVGDFNGDGAADIAFRNTTTGDMGYMAVNAAGGETWHEVGPTSIGYAPLGVGDFNGDGVMDIAFRSTTTGDMGYMSIDPGGGETWHDMGSTSLAYTPIGVGDFDGQGLAEVAFRNTATGDWGYMSANPGGGETWHEVGSTSTAYNAVKVADFSNDGISSIAFVNPTTGDFGYMEPTPGGGEAWHSAGSTSTDYYVIA